jgi:hypothetical protein
VNPDKVFPPSRWLVLLAALAWHAAALGAADVWIAGWREAEPLTTPRAGAAVVRAGDHVYAIGGVDGQRFLRTVEFTTLLPDGRLAPWQPTAPLNEARGFFAAVVHGGYLYVAGGGNGDNGKNLLRSLERAPLRADGRLGSWQRLDVMLNYTRRCVKLALVGDSLYAMGGFGGVLLDTVERADFGPDGTLGPFTVEPNRFAVPRYINAAAETERAVYVLGGHDQREGVGIPNVEYALAGPSLAWRPAEALRRGRYGPSAAVLGAQLYALGGLDGPVYLDSIETSRIAPDGSLSPWRETTPLSSPRANFGTFEDRGRLYVVGGSNRGGYFRGVEYAERNAEGELGFHGSAAEARAYEQRRAQQARPAGALPNEGVVQEVIQTDAYSYLRVSGPQGERWIAAPRTAYKVKDRIRYSRGMEMGNFYSRALDRTFDSILFVGDTARAE